MTYVLCIRKSSHFGAIGQWPSLWLHLLLLIILTFILVSIILCSLPRGPDI